MLDDEMYKKAAKRADEKIEFIRHLYCYVIVNVLLIILNLLTSPNNLWFYWITVFWGIGLLLHFIKTYITTGKVNEEYREKMIEKEIGRAHV